MSPKWRPEWAHIIDLNKTTTPLSWWSRHQSLIAFSTGVISLIVAGFSAWYARETLTAEQRPLMEIVSSDASDHKSIKLSLKNSGRATAVNVRLEYQTDIGTRPPDQNIGLHPFTVKKTVARAGGSFLDVASGGLLDCSLDLLVSVQDLQVHKMIAADDRIRLNGTVRYDDLSDHHFALPVCFEFIAPLVSSGPLVACNVIEHQRM